MSLLTVDISGTKTLMTLVDGAEVVDRTEPEVWVQQMANMAKRWTGQFDRAGITVTGLVKDNHWRALNAETLAILGRFALHEAAEQALDVHVTLYNDAQAAAWGEYVHGSGQRKDIVFLTISTGVGGGVVSNGRLLSGRGGVTGHFGQVLPLPEGSEGRFEDCASGHWIAAEGKKLDHAADARAVFSAAADGNEAAENILQTSARRVGRLSHNLQLMFGPHITVIGGGIGLALGFMTRMAASVEHFQPLVRPKFVQAGLEKDTGVIGVADL